MVQAGRTVVDGDVDSDLLRSLIDHMLWQHPLRDSVDASKIGARGVSFGGFAVASLAGAVLGDAPDERVRAVIIDESASCDPTVHDCSLVTIPVMLRDGSPLVPDLGPTLAALVNAFPRFQVTLDNPAHLGFATGTCGTVEALRQASLAYQAANGGVVEPEPRNLSYVLTSLAVSIGDTAGFSASNFWNLDSFAPNLGSNGDYCGPQDGGPATPGLGTVMDNQTMIETKQALNLGFWETVFGNGNSKTTKLEKAVEKLDSVTSFVKVTE